MKKEIAFFKDKRFRVNSAKAIIDAFRAMGLSDEEIIAEMKKIKEKRQLENKHKQEVVR